MNTSLPVRLPLPSILYSVLFLLKQRVSLFFRHSPNPYRLCRRWRMPLPPREVKLLQHSKTIDGEQTTVGKGAARADAHRVPRKR